MEKYFTTTYNSPVGKIIIAASEQGLIWCGFSNLPLKKQVDIVASDNNVYLSEAIKWLESYFVDNQPNINNLHLAPMGTSFQQDVWECLKTIKYGQTTTYGAIAKSLAIKYGKQKMSAQAVGQAVGNNPLGIIVPCHRVVGVNGKLVGYAGGLDKKIALLTFEGLKIDKNKNRLV